MVNILDGDKDISRLLKVISAPPRLKILRAIGEKEVCVCHLEAVFPQWRQAFVSQHLMALRTANILSTRRDGRFIFYRLTDLRYLELIEMAADIIGLTGSGLQPIVALDCECPSCETTSITKQAIPEH